MQLELTAAQRKLRAELRDYFATLVKPEERSAMRTERHGGVFREIVRRMGRDGWLGVGWPREYGGRGFGRSNSTCSPTRPRARTCNCRR